MMQWRKPDAVTWERRTGGMSKYIEIGFTALRDPATGGFLPAVPLYIESAEDVKDSEAAMIKDIGHVFADKFKQYVDAGGLDNHKRG